LRANLAAINDNYLGIQQDILESFVERGQLQHLAQPTHTPSGKRIPGLKLDNPRQLAVMHALVRFAQIAAAGTFSTTESIRMSPPLSAAPGNATVWARGATTSPSCVPKALSKSFTARAAIDCRPRDIRSA
jgi:hypothetical protein